LTEGLELGGKTRTNRTRIERQSRSGTLRSGRESVRLLGLLGRFWRNNRAVVRARGSNDGHGQNRQSGTRGGSLCGVKLIGGDEGDGEGRALGNDRELSRRKGRRIIDTRARSSIFGSAPFQFGQSNA
jgi:hypothetical protein